MEDLVKIAFKEISLKSKIYDKLIEDIEENRPDLSVRQINEDSINEIRKYLYKKYREQRRLVDALCEKLINYLSQNNIQKYNQKTF